MQIIPSIVAQNLEEVKAKIIRVEGLVDWVELDIVDGIFASNYTWPLNAPGQAPEDLKAVDGKIKISAHLMVEHPETMIDSWRDIADQIIIHYESTDELEKIIGEQTEQTGLGLALELNTPVEKIYHYLDRIKLVQLMSIERIGYSGEKFDEQVLNKIKTLKTNWPDVKIIVDGGVDLEIAKKLKGLGVSGVVVGSRVWEAKNIEAAIKAFQTI